MSASALRVRWTSTSCLWVFCVLLCLVEASRISDCYSTGARSIKFSLLSKRNSTGHWIAQVQLGHGARESDSGPWEVNIDHSTVTCENNDAILISATVTAPPQSNSHYELVTGLGYYKFHATPKNWFQARKICIQEGADLAVLNSETEARSLILIWREYPKIFDDWKEDNAFIGIHDNYKEGEFVTVLNQSLNSTGFQKWHPNEPNGGTGENCGCLHKPEGTLADVSCSLALPFFCEREI
ncbi:hemolymph lipopolysaccharide-binding protein-like [Periplaneta americana]|uniref:hemolymph lipopolysaccharide-binding protein-like n=1 Tax=Periplaneta americana TaxID=6978 RepID=UPI0037E8C8C6